MNVNLYRNDSEPNTIYKNKVDLGINLSGDFRDEFNVINPVIRVNGDIMSFKSANYCYISELKRYYFITSMNVARTGIIDISLKVDVLQTYANSILTIKGILKRAEKADFHDKYINDPDRIFEDLDYHIPMLFTGGSTSMSPKLILLTCASLTDS